MKKEFILLIVSLTLSLFGSDLMYAQIGVLKSSTSQNGAVTPRRGDATPGIPGFVDNDGNVNNVFGAGESATIQGNNVIVPGASHPITPIPPPPNNKIVLGGDQSQNIVISSYTGNGYGIGWISVLRVIAGDEYSTTTTGFHINHVNTDYLGYQFPLPYPEVDSDLEIRTTSGNIPNTYQIRYIDDPNAQGTAIDQRPDDFDNLAPHTANSGYDVMNPMVFSFNSWNASNFATWSPPAPCNSDLFTSSISGNTITVQHHLSEGNGVRYPADPIFAPNYGYTSTMDGSFAHSPTYNSIVLYTENYRSDDGISLTQFNGSPLTNSLSLSQQNRPTSEIGKSSANDDPTSKVYYLDNYNRPTTVAIAPTVDNSYTELDSIQLNTIEWWAERNVVDTQIETLNLINLSTNVPVSPIQQSGYVMFQCNSGSMTAWGFEAIWDPDVILGATKLDAAVQLLDGARVCVKKDVVDLTGNIGTGHVLSGDNVYATGYKQTNALVIFPEEDRVTLRTYGNFNANMHHERTPGSQSTNALYTISSFPDPDDHIYMYKGASAPHAFDMPGNLSSFQNVSSFITSFVIAAPLKDAKASIFGVYTDYAFTGQMPEIHTTAASDASFAPVGVDNNPGVIEIGPTTAGKDHFHIYSGGMLKNFEGCTVGSNFSMQLGTASGGMAKLHIDNTADLSILNYGNNGANFCEAKIILQTGAMAVIQPAIETAAGTGAFRVQALSNVEIQEEVNITKTNKGNNIYVLSDGGNVIAEKTVNIASDYFDTVGSGMITFWAEDKNDANFASCLNTVGNRNSARGNIYLKDDATITRAGTVGDTETNYVAANNIRTANFDYSSTSTKNDITNIISRKGDIYLGYSKKDDGVFNYEIVNPANAGALNIKAGFDDTNESISPAPLGGGNIYFRAINAKMIKGGTYPNNITIPYSLQYVCDEENQLSERRNVPGSSMQDYEHAGIIGGLGRCGYDHDFTNFGGLVDKLSAVNPGTVTIPSLKYTANMGELFLDAGTRGNIIMNTGSDLDFQGDAGNGFFRTRNGDIDLRGITKITNLPEKQGVVFLADNGNPNKKAINCYCDEQSNNIYIQDFDFITFNDEVNLGSLYFGADNNIKLQYGGLRDIGTWQDPFLSEADITLGYPCGLKKYHCDSDPNENQAQDMILDFTDKKSGGVGIVASDQIDIYKDFTYIGGSTSGMSAVPVPVSTNPYVNNAPTDGRLHGESVAGYGLFIKTQGNKSNWKEPDPSACGPSCDLGCGFSPLQSVSRLTFHSNATIFAENSKVHVSSPVVDVIGELVLDAKAASQIQIKTDSLILREQFLLDGTKTSFATWSDMPRNMPVIKLGNSRYTPPIGDDCTSCFTHQKGTGSKDNRTAVDTVNVQFWNNAGLPRLHTLVVDHTVLAFGTDSIDNITGGTIINATIFTDTIKIRNQVEFWSNADHNYDTHFELASEPQMNSKNFPGIFARHLHMEPIAPSCKNDNSSDLWLSSDVLDVISSSTFGGFGRVHADVYVEPAGILAPGYTSLRNQGQCYERQAGALKMENLFLDHDADLYFSVGDKRSSEGLYADRIEVKNLKMYGPVNLYIEERCDQTYLPGCYPLINYDFIEGPTQLNNLQLKTTTINGMQVRLDFSIPGEVNLCVGNGSIPVKQREIRVPEPPAGVTINPSKGTHFVEIYKDFNFKMTFSDVVFAIRTNRLDPVTGEQEQLFGKQNANGEYEYTISEVVTQPVYIYIGPDDLGPVGIDDITGAAVWANENTLYIRVSQEDLASIYSITGMLVKRIEVPGGGITEPLSKGAYIVTLKDGSVHKVIVK
ncbi:MAG: hypothetical protein LBE56_11960 [Tannerella sp.]|jgi:hypothetical protein|nr:hypothetical protein [Tannerella sp.]